MSEKPQGTWVFWDVTLCQWVCVSHPFISTVLMSENTKGHVITSRRPES